jgi:hypothetical protein
VAKVALSAPGSAGETVAVRLVELPERLAEGVRRQLAERIILGHQCGIGLVAAVRHDPRPGIEALGRAADDAVEILSRHVGDHPAHVAGRRLDQFGEIVGLDIECPGIVEHLRDLRVVEDAVDECHDGEILHRLVGDLTILQQRAQTIGRG